MASASTNSCSATSGTETSGWGLSTTSPAMAASWGQGCQAYDGGQTEASAGGAARVSDRLDHGHLDDSEREWLRASRRNAARRSWLLIGVLVVIAIILAWLTVDGLPGPRRAAPTTTTVDQRAITDGERALADWGEFAVSNTLADVKDSFWANGPQYKKLAKEAKTRKRAGPPPYKMTISDV